MKKAQLIFASVVLTFLLSISVSAGIMEAGVAQPPPTPTPAPTSVMAESDAAEAEGVITTGVASPESVEVIALSVLQSVLALF